ncbi:MAG: extensin family protein [Myxococcota bacterium]
MRISALLGCVYPTSRAWWTALVAAALLTGCVGDRRPPGPSVDVAASAPELSLPGEPEGSLGGACEIDGDCRSDGAVCFLDGYPRGTCSLPCGDGACPVSELGMPTFCAAVDQLPGDVGWVGAGACLPSCDFGVFPGTGCRQGYGCVPLAKANTAAEVRYGCLPGLSTPLDGALATLASLGARFTPVERAVASVPGRPDLVCQINDAVELRAQVGGIVFERFDGPPEPTLLVSAELGVALLKTARVLEELGVRKVLHMGTFNCRTIRGTTKLSRHGLGGAIDVFGFVMADGARYLVKSDWERVPARSGGKLLASVVERLTAAGLFRVILTPEYNRDHEDHFHLDVLPLESEPDAVLKRWPSAIKP